MRPTLEDARLALTRHFGYADFRPGQVDVIASVLSGADTLGVLPTGGGKSLCFQVPALVLPGVTVVISPLISLMKDQVDRLVSLGIAATYLNSTLPPDESRRRLRSIERGVARLVYAAPERFVSADLREALQRGGIALLAVDEAHCISEWGHEFRPSFRRIAAAAGQLGAPQVVALTATATPAVRRDIVQQLRMRAPRVIVGGFDRPNLSFAVRRCRDDEDKERELVRLIRAERGMAVVYATTRADVTRIVRRLARQRIAAVPYHGGLPAGQRAEAQDAFMREQVRAIVATNAFGMGVDKPNVRLVTHYAMPGTLEAYYQEAGRAGRDGRPGRCVLLVAPNDRSTHDYFIRSTFPDAGIVRRVLACALEIAAGDRIPSRPEALAHRERLSPTDVRAALLWLEREGVLARAERAGPVHLRLMALPARIAAELPEGSRERETLRALWRRSGARLMDGVMVSDPPPVRVLRALRDRQFLDVDSPGDALVIVRRADPEALDLSRLERRRAAEMMKLERMLGYVTTTACRRRTVLAYFGERQASVRCDGCDNCRTR